MRFKTSGLPILALSAVLLFGACKKDKGDDTGTPPPPEPPSLADKHKDTTVLYSRDIYLWHTQIPSTFNGRAYSDPAKIMEAIRVYSKEPGFANPVDEWSFAVDQDSWDNVSGGVSQDFGMEIFFLGPNDLRVKLVEQNSPAGKAGVRRGWQIVSINGNSNINTTQSSINFIIENVYNSASSSFVFKKADGTETSLTLNGASYQTSPILFDSIYTAGTKKVGYLAFNSFLGDTNQVYNRFNEVFSEFAQANITDVVIDLRYNGGGYVSVQDKLANYLVPVAGNGDVMMNQEFNERYADWNETSRFSKLGTLDLDRIFFIVSENTASASELLINNLTPFMDVKIVGPSPSYGKPVGYFPIPVGDWYIFPISFRSTNKLGSGNYFDGFIPDKQVGDGLDKDWGDPQEACLATALGYINLGTFGAMPELPGVAAMERTRDSRVLEGNRRFAKKSFKGMVDTRRMKQ